MNVASDQSEDLNSHFRCQYFVQTFPILLVEQCVNVCAFANDPFGKILFEKKLIK